MMSAESVSRPAAWEGSLGPVSFAELPRCSHGPPSRQVSSQNLGYVARPVDCATSLPPLPSVPPPRLAVGGTPPQLAPDSPPSSGPHSVTSSITSPTNQWINPKNRTMQLALASGLPNEVVTPSRTRSLNHIPTPCRRGHKDRLLKRVYRQLVARHSSLHAAFADVGARRGQLLCQREFQAAMEQMGVQDSYIDKLFAVVDTRRIGSVALAEVRAALAATSQDSLLWELRCGLVAAGIQPQFHRRALQQCARLVNLHQPSAIEIAVHKIHAGVTPVTSPAGSALPKAPRTPSSAVLLTQSKWKEFCDRLGLLSSEASRLFAILGNSSDEHVDLGHVLTRVRAVAAPNVSLECFAMKAVLQFGSFREAFCAFCSEPTRTLDLAAFRALAESLDVNNRNASRLWQMLAPVGAAFESDAAAARATISEELFVTRMSSQAPDEALVTLAHQLCKHFGNLVEGRRALARCGFTDVLTISAATLDSVLRGLGIATIDASHVLQALEKSGKVADVESLFESLREAQQASRFVIPATEGLAGRLSESGCTPDASYEAPRNSVRTSWKREQQQLRECQRASEEVEFIAFCPPEFDAHAEPDRLEVLGVCEEPPELKTVDVGVCTTEFADDTAHIDKRNTRCYVSTDDIGDNYSRPSSASLSSLCGRMAGIVRCSTSRPRSSGAKRSQSQPLLKSKELGVGKYLGVGQEVAAKG